MDKVNIVPQPNQYVIDWNKVLLSTNDSVQYKVDTDTNGSYETVTNLKPVFQDITSPTTTIAFT
jgi:hypothetical protein